MKQITAMPYRMKFFLFLLAGNVLVFFGAYRLREFSPAVLVVFAGLALYAAIIGGRWLLGRKQL